MKLLEIIESPEFRKYWDTVSCISKDNKGNSLCQSDRQLFFYEKYHDERQYKEHTVDSLMVNQNNGKYTINLIEFKGGLTPENWDKDCFALKAFDTIHCGLSKLIDDSDEWVKIFSCNLRYYIVCSDDNVIFKNTETSKEELRKRNAIIKNRQKLDKMQGSLERYKQRRPFENIIVTCSTVFLDRHLNKVAPSFRTC